MSEASSWKREAVTKAIISISVTILLAIAASVSSTFRGRVQLYDPTLLAFFVLVFLTSAAWDLFTFRKSKEVKLVSGYYALTMVAFVFLTAWSRESTVKDNVPLLLALGILAFSKLSHLSGMYHFADRVRQHRDQVGYAVTGIVVYEAPHDEPYFILILNLNLREGRGLWVPPGGHFTPHLDDPQERLVTKVENEIGVVCKLFDVARHFVGSHEGLTTDHVAWLTPPVFMLDENLMGPCSQGHHVHIDFVYLLVTDGAPTRRDHKYPEGQQIEIPVRRCKESAQAAEEVITGAIDAWHHRAFGKKPGLKDALTKDVVWRLHLAAQVYLQMKGSAQ